METVASGMALRDPWSVQQVSRLVPNVSDSGSYRIGLITLDVKGAGARSAGNPLATCDVAGVGNGIFPEDLRASARPYRCTFARAVHKSAELIPQCPSLNTGVRLAGQHTAGEPKRGKHEGGSRDPGNGQRIHGKKL